MQKLWRAPLQIIKYSMLKSNINYLKYIDSQLGFVSEIIEVIEIDNYKFVFFQPKGHSNPFNDDRLKFTNNIGPLRINMNNNNYEIMGAIQFLFEYGDRPEYLKTVIEDDLKTYNSIVSNAIRRKRLNPNDFEDVIYSISGKYSDGEMRSKLKRNLKEMVLDVNSDVIRELVLRFLKDTNAKYNEIEKNIFEVFLDI
jgi:hypothetical protein